jgi:hypothetical protein
MPIIKQIVENYADAFSQGSHLEAFLIKFNFATVQYMALLLWCINMFISIVYNI